MGTVCGIVILLMRAHGKERKGKELWEDMLVIFFLFPDMAFSNFVSSWTACSDIIFAFGLVRTQFDIFE